MKARIPRKLKKFHKKEANKIKSLSGRMLYLYEVQLEVNKRHFRKWHKSLIEVISKNSGLPLEIFTDPMHEKYKGIAIGKPYIPHIDPTI